MIDSVIVTVFKYVWNNLEMRIYFFQYKTHNLCAQIECLAKHIIPKLSILENLDQRIS